VRGALLVAPPDIERDDLPPNLHAWRPILRQPLPFTAIAVTSDDDPYSGAERSAGLVRAWGARQIGIGAAGHINGESGLDDWPAGQAWVSELTTVPALRPSPRQDP
jgi:predicted alpha/beta hydrolase family esterase